MTETIDESAVVERVLDWFTDNWDPDCRLLEWRQVLLESGWAVPAWEPEWFGRGLPPWTERVAHETIRRAGGVAVPLGIGMGLAAPTIHEHGSRNLKSRLLPPTITGSLKWCQLFSEPGAGSDLAGLQTTAERDGSQWVVSGQKLWSTGAEHADMGLLLARTNRTAPKHVGITCFALEMHQPGIEIRSIRQMNDRSSFNEVFLDEVVVDDADVIGEVNRGWPVARATLAHERSYSTQREVYFRPGAVGRIIDEARREAESYLLTYEWYPQRKGRFDLLVERSRELGLSTDPVLRDELMKVWTFERAASLTAKRAAAQDSHGRPPGPEGSIGKLALSEVARRCSRVHTMIAGASAMLAGSEGDDVHAAVAETLISTPAQSIAGGTDEVQKNIVGERILGLPKEPSTDEGGSPGEARTTR